MKAFGILAALASIWAPMESGLAQNPEIQESVDLAKKVKQLEAEVAELKSLRSTSAPGEGLASFLSGLSFQGYVESQYVHNFNDPASGANAFRVFDNKANTFRLHNVEFDLARWAKNPNDFGFRVVTNFGQDANLFAASGSGNADEFDVQQGFVEWLAPIGSGLNLRMGKMAALMGAEVIEAPVNDQISRSFSFGYAMPATHTGIRAAYTEDIATFVLGVNNGWDNWNDNNNRPTVEGAIAASPTDFLSLSVGGLIGPEQTGINTHPRRLIDVVMTIKPLAPLTLKFSYDYGAEETTTLNQWSGVTGYLRWRLDEQWALSGRAEYFSDDDGFRTGLVQDLVGYTVTSEFRPCKGPIFRLEGRWDRSTNPAAFPDATAGQTRSGQATVALQAIFSF